MSLKRATDDMPQAANDEVHIETRTGLSHAPHCCGKLPQDCVCVQPQVQQPQQQSPAEQQFHETQDAAFQLHAALQREQAKAESATPGTTDPPLGPAADVNVQAEEHDTINLDDDDDDLQGGVKGKEDEADLGVAPDAQALPLFREASPAQ